MDVSVIGLGKLGLPLAAALASRDFKVTGVDIRQDVVDSINAGVPHIYEPGIDELVADVTGKDALQATTDISKAMKTDITFILVPTPSQNDGAFSLNHVLQVTFALSCKLGRKDSYHLVVISSTVMPGSCTGAICESLEAFSGRKVGDSLGLCYCPEFVALGDCINGFKQPDFVLIGESDKRAGDLLQSVYEQFCENEPPFARTSLVNAEIAKVALNFTVTAKISVANTLAELCEGIPGADVDEVTNAIGLDSRIGLKYLKGATAFGGTCFPRDVRAVILLAREVKAKPTLPRAINAANLWQIERLCAFIDGEARSKSRLGILGLAFKPGTDVTEESTGMAIFDRVAGNAFTFDPVVPCTEKSAQSCVNKSDIVVITTPCQEFQGLTFKEGQTVIDCWRLYDDVSPAKHIAMGKGPDV